MDETILSVENLNVRFGSAIAAVRDVSFTVGREKVAIVGESGSGKSTLGKTIIGLQPRSAKVTADKLQFKDIDLLTASERMMQSVRGRRISMILQDPKYSLNPVVKVGEQIAEAYRMHHNASARDARERALEMLHAVRIRDPEHVFGKFPHQVSGGMGQRIMIAMMLVPEPDLMIADEPTSALDVAVRLQILAILDDLVADKGRGLIFITHDLNLVRTFCDRVLVMYAGRVVEQIAARDLHHAQHPYTRGLLDSLPDVDRPRKRLPVLKRDPAWLTG